VTPARSVAFSLAFPPSLDGNPAYSPRAPAPKAAPTSSACSTKIPARSARFPRRTPTRRTSRRCARAALLPPRPHARRASRPRRSWLSVSRMRPGLWRPRSSSTHTFDGGARREARGAPHAPLDARERLARNQRQEPATGRSPARSAPVRQLTTHPRLQVRDEREREPPRFASPRTRQQRLAPRRNRRVRSSPVHRTAEDAPLNALAELPIPRTLRSILVHTSAAVPLATRRAAD
jgi:hypothetical protein